MKRYRISLCFILCLLFNLAPLAGQDNQDSTFVGAKTGSANNNIYCILDILDVFPTDLGTFFYESDIDSIVKTLNANNVYGKNNWRLPTSSELQLLYEFAAKIGLKTYYTGQILSYWYHGANDGNKEVRLVASRESSKNDNNYIEICGVKWALYNAGTSFSTPYGTHYTYAEARKACPEGWRLPYIEEFHSLTQNGSSIVNNNGIIGCWFSGANAYVEGETSIFLPAAGDCWFREEGTAGYYWSSTYAGRGQETKSDRHSTLWFGDFGIKETINVDYWKLSVRCVKN